MEEIQDHCYPQQPEQPWCAWQSCKEKATALQKKIAAHLQFAKDHVDKPEGYWRNVLWTFKRPK